jgi:hypothetical protein
MDPDVGVGSVIVDVAWVLAVYGEVRSVIDMDGVNGVRK